MKTRKMVTIVCLALIVALIAGCGNQSGGNATPSNSAGASSNAENVELTWWVDARDDVQAAYEKIKADFESLHPNVKINLVKTSDDKIVERISIAANTGEFPDIQQGSFFWPLAYAYKNMLVPIDDVVDKDDFSPEMLSQLSVQDNLYVYPNSSVVIGLLVNKTLFENKGAADLLPTDMSPWSFEQFEAAAKAVTDPSSQTYGYGMFAGDYAGDQQHHAMLWGFGAETWSEDGEAVLNSPEGIEGLTFLTKLVDDGVIPPGSASIKAVDMLNNNFIQGNLGMIFGNVGHVAAINTAFENGSAEQFEVDLVPFPSKDGNSSNTVLFGYGMWLWDTKDETKLKWSKEFVKFANNPENSKLMAEAPSVLAARDSLASSYEQGSLQEKTTRLFQYIGNVGFQLPGYQETRNAFYPEIQAALIKAKTPEQALNDWVKKANDIVEKSK